MDLETPAVSEPGDDSCAKRWLARAAILALLVAITGLSTLAKNGQYFPKSTPARYVSLSTKMNVTSAPAVPEPGPAEVAAKLVPAQTVIPIARVEPRRVPRIKQIDITVSTRLRAPPSPLS